MLGQHVTVYALGRDGDRAFFRAVDPAVELRIVPVPDVAGEAFGARVVRLIGAMADGFERDAFARGGFDIVHAQDCISANAVPVDVRTVHHLDHFTTPELVACHERSIVTPPHHVCVSAAVAAELAAGWGIGATVILNGVDAARFERAAGPGPTAVAGRARWRDKLAGSPLVVTVGGIEPRKGTLELVGAVAAVRRDLPGVVLAIGGGVTLFDYRPYRALVDDRCARLGLAPVVLGPLPHDELPALVAAADVFVFPSTVEGFGLAALEALAAGVPVVTSPLPVFEEVFGAAVRYGADEESIAAAIVDAARRPDEARRDAGRALARGYRWSAAAAGHLDLYRRIRAQA